jgi:hypothetical protein
MELVILEGSYFEVGLQSKVYNSLVYIDMQHPIFKIPSAYSGFIHPVHLPEHVEGALKFPSFNENHYFDHQGKKWHLTLAQGFDANGRYYLDDNGETSAFTSQRMVPDKLPEIFRQLGKSVIHGVAFSGVVGDAFEKTPSGFRHSTEKCDLVEFYSEGHIILITPKLLKCVT